MDSFLGIQEISIEIERVEKEKLQLKQRLGLFWELSPVANMMQQIRNYVMKTIDWIAGFLPERNSLFFSG